ncbi:MAG: phage portal protein [Phycisphaerales bacterium]|nr:phage portal protein [Phycisphaerales bacterium]
MPRASEALPGFEGIGLSEELLTLLLAEHDRVTLPRLSRLWRYYRNPDERDSRGTVGGGPGGAWLGQAEGLPSRLIGPAALHEDDRATREIVIENDIAWRVQSMVDFMFGKPVQILSTARDAATRRRVEHALDAVWEASGGIALLQDMALLGHVYGHVDLLLRATGNLRGTPVPGDGAADPVLRVEVIEPARGIPVVNAGDYRALDAYIVRVRRETRGAAAPVPIPAPGPWRRLVKPFGAAPRRAVTETVEVIGPHHTRVYEGGRLLTDAPNTLTPADLPVAHIQNVSEPFRYEGLSEVEPLIPLQDELNTRLSDRAFRVTMQSFRMFLARGLDGAGPVPVGPGRIITTDNPDASITAVGGDAESPSEAAHIQEVREAIDKASCVPPLASGVLRARIGNLTSANALRITLMGLLAKTARKRVTYGRGITRISTLILRALDHAGVLRTDERDRGVRLEWPDPLPADLTDQVAAARAKADLGVPRERVLAELGYPPTDPGVV